MGATFPHSLRGQSTRQISRWNKSSPQDKASREADAAVEQNQNRSSRMRQLARETPHRHSKMKQAARQLLPQAKAKSKISRQDEANHDEASHKTNNTIERQHRSGVQQAMRHAPLSKIVTADDVRRETDTTINDSGRQGHAKVISNLEGSSGWHER